MKVPHRLILLSVLLSLAALPAPAMAEAGQLKFDESSFEVLEEAGVAVIIVERSKGEDGAVSVDFTTQDGSAVAGSDYGSVTGNLSWEDGDGGNRIVEIPIFDDGEAEGVETVMLILSNPTGGATLDARRATSVLRILASDGGGGPGGDDNGGDDGGDDNGGDDGGDDGGGDDNGGDDGSRAGVLKFDQRNFVVLESTEFAVISVERSKGESGAVTVEYSTEDHKAVAGSDYEAVSGTLSWEDGDEAPKTFQVPILDDGEHEPSENLRLQLSNATGGAGIDQAKSWAFLTIHDDDQGDDGGDDAGPGKFEFVGREYQIIEGEPFVVISVKRDDGSRGAVSVEYSTADGTAVDGSDYTGVSGVLSWADRDRSRKTFEVPILEDGEEEGNETVDLLLSNPTGGATLEGDDDTAVLTILDNDGSTSLCTGSDTVLCLLGGRFQVAVVWRTTNGNLGDGHMIPESDNAGLVWFFDPGNIEMLIKVLDACQLPGFETFWVFFAATTNVDFTVTVTDTATGVVKEYMNPAGQAAEPIQDTLSFQTCP